jgi:hypothetical protein
MHSVSDASSRSARRHLSPRRLGADASESRRAAAAPPAGVWAGRRARTGGRVMGVRAVERAGGRQGGEGCRAEREEQKPKSRSAPRGACDGAGRSWPPARRPRVEVVTCTVACKPRPEPASSIGRRPRSPGRRRPARPRPRRAGRWATLEVDHGLDASRDQPPPHVDDRAGRRQRHSLQTCRHLVRHAAWSVVSRPWWPVFAACSMSITSAPRTSTTIRSGQMRSALRTSAWSGTAPRSSTLGGRASRPDEVRIGQLQLGRVLDGDDALAGREGSREHLEQCDIV